MSGFNANSTFGFGSGGSGGGGTNMEARYAEQGSYGYCGIAPLETLESENKWTIRRLLYAPDGSVTVDVAKNVTWTGYATHTYVPLI